MIALAIDLLRGFGFTADQVVVRLSDREFWTDLLRAQNVPEERWSELLQVIDKSEREPREKTSERLGPLAGPVFEVLDGGGRSEKLELLVQQLGTTRPGRLREGRPLDRPRARLLHRRRLRGFRSRRSAARDRRRRPLRQTDRAIERRRRFAAGGRIRHGRRRARRTDQRNARGLYAASPMSSGSRARSIFTSSSRRRNAGLRRCANCSNCATPAGGSIFRSRAAKVGKQFQTAEAFGAKVTLLYGDEWPAVKMKTLATREEVLVPQEELLTRVKESFAA